MAILTAALLADEGPIGPSGPAAPVPATPLASGGWRQGHLSPADFIEQARLRWPTPVDSGPLAVDILRAERDARR